MNLAAVALAAATVAALLARHWWAFDLFSHFQLQYVVLGCVLGLAALAWRAYAAAAVLGAAAALHAWTISDLWLGGTSATAGLPLRVATVNILDANPTPGRLLEFARAWHPDLLLVVDAESDRWREVLAELGKLYSYRAPEGWRDGQPLSLFSRLPILQEREEEPPVGERPFLVAKVALGAETVTVVGVHPSAPSPTEPGDSRVRNWQLDDLAATVEGAGRPVIVAGDFNTSPWSPHFRELLAEAGLRNAAEGQGWIATWPSWFWPARVPIDHVLVGGRLGVASLERGPDIGSDHYPVVADLRLPRG
jgi:endonuclease/exonuclease/phosphatase (EEP) superfamily protein YafD